MADYTNETSSYDDKELERIVKRYKRACKRRELNDSLLDQCYEFALPLRERPYASKDDGKPDLDRLFDSTAPAALQDMASNMLDDVWPVDMKPFELEAGPDIPAGQKEELNKLLSGITEDIISTINNSNFRNEAHEALMDWGIGTGNLLADEGDALEPVRFRCVPLTECYFDTGPRDEIDCLYRPRKIRHENLKTLWPDGDFGDEIERAITESPDKEIEIIEAAYRDWSERGREVWKFCVFSEKHKQKIETKEASGDGSKPFIDFSFTRVPGEVLGRGPVMTALPDIKTLNLTKQFLLENADLAISGAWLADDDGVMNLDTVRIEPRTIIPRAPGSKGLERLEIGSDGFQIAQLEIEALQNQIKQVMFGDDLGAPTGTPMSATEVLERTANRARRRAGPYHRLINELLFQTVRRVAYIRVKQGAIRLPGIDGRLIRIRPLAPITRAQAQDEILRHSRFMEMSIAHFGPQQTALVVDAQAGIRWLAQKWGEPPTILRNKVQSEQMAQAIALMNAAAAMQGGTVKTQEPTGQMAA